VIVDPAGFPFIGKNNAKGAGGASGSIYTWLGIRRTGSFPPEVHRYFNFDAEVCAETLAKFHTYSEGQHVIHAIGPKVMQLREGLHDLARTYHNVLVEFCDSIRNGNRKVPKTLRLSPISSGIFLMNKRLEKHMPQVTWSALSVAIMMLPPSLQDELKHVAIEVCIFQKNEFAAYEASLQTKQAMFGSGMVVLSDMNRVEKKLSKHGGSGYEWVRNKNGPMDRLRRLAVALTTSGAISLCGYTLPGQKVVKLCPIKEMLEGSHLRRTTEVRKAQSSQGSGRSTKVSKDEEHQTVMEVAIRYQRGGKKTVAVNAASAYSVGGGVLHGGRHALEESWCSMSTLLPSLQKVHFENRHAEASQNIPVDGCVVSPGVEIFRATSDDGYAFQASPTRLVGVCSVAMFNMNPRVTDSPQDAPHDFDAYCRQTKQKFRVVITGAAELGGEVLVCPDVGCGVFENDPQVVGSLLGEAIRELDGALAEVVLTGKSSFCEAVRRSASGEKVHYARPRYFTSDDANAQPTAVGSSAGGYGDRDYDASAASKAKAAPAPPPTAPVDSAAPLPPPVYSIGPSAAKGRC